VPISEIGKSVSHKPIILIGIERFATVPAETKDFIINISGTMSGFSKGKGMVNYNHPPGSQKSIVFSRLYRKLAMIFADIEQAYQGLAMPAVLIEFSPPSQRGRVETSQRTF
jgi:hypothetical protein